MQPINTKISQLLSKCLAAAVRSARANVFCRRQEPYPRGAHGVRVDC